MDAKTIEVLEKIFAEFPFMKASPAPTSEVRAAEQNAGITFDASYKDFVSRYGGAMVGALPVFGTRRADPMGESLWSVDEVTRNFREDGWPGAGEIYVISVDQAGNPIGVNEAGAVVSFDHDTGEMFLVAASFDDFIWSLIREFAGD